MAAAGCDKQVAAAPPIHPTSLAGKPTTLFLLFGDQADPRLLPVATVVAGRIAPITLDSAGWRTFDKLYFETGAPVSIYKNGAPAAPASIRRGMWTDADVLYKLPGCRSLRPLGAVTRKSVV